MMNFIRKKRARKGFTLVELVVVVAIIAILTAMAAPRFMAMTDSSRVSAVQANMNTLKTAVTMYQAAGNPISTLTPLTLTQLQPYISNMGTSTDVIAHFTGNPAGSTYSFVAHSGAVPAHIKVVLIDLGSASKFVNSKNGIALTTAGDDSSLTFTYYFE